MSDSDASTDEIENSYSDNSNVISESDNGDQTDIVDSTETGISKENLLENTTESASFIERRNVPSDDSDDEPFSPVKLKKNENIKPISEDEISIEDDQQAGTNSDESFRINLKKNKNRILSEDESSEEDEQQNGNILEDTAAGPSGVNNIVTQLKNSRISSDFKLKDKIANSTLIGNINLTPRNADSGKRLLNTPSDTPRTFKQTREFDRPSKILIASSSEDSESDDIIDVSDDDLPKKHSKNLRQPTLKEVVRTNDGAKEHVKQPILQDVIDINDNSIEVNEETGDFIEVSPHEYEIQSDIAKKAQIDFQKMSDVLQKINTEHLPDKGESLRNKIAILEKMQVQHVERLSKMRITKENKQRIVPINPKSKIKTLTLAEIEAGTNKVVPKTFGKQAMSTYNAQKALTLDRLEQLVTSLGDQPKKDDVCEPPKGLKVELMTHQLRALTWLIWREGQKPSGGILADDMGLGKTLTMISLMLKCNEIERNTDSDDDDDNEEENDRGSVYRGGTLVVCPASLINQWSSELERRTKRGLVSCELYHGQKRESKPKRLAKYDMVVTTYTIVNNESYKNGAIFRIKWRRIIIDEAHQIRNHKSQTCEAVCKLKAKSRWALTGTPVHNKELDMYSLLKFLRCSPFDDINVWKRWVGEKSLGGSERLHTVISTLMLRRTKVELIEEGLLNVMPERKWEVIPVELTKQEKDVYSRILIFSRTLFAQFLHQKAEKKQDYLDANYNANGAGLNNANQEYFQMRRKLLNLNKLKDIKQHEILVLLLRLRQICCHPALITGMLHEDMELLGDDEAAADEAGALDFLHQLNNLTLDDHPDDHKPDRENSEENLGLSAEGGSSLKDAAKNILNPSDPIFSKTRMSSKIKAVIKLMKEKIITCDDKAIIVSQWPTFLNLIAHHLKEEGIHYDQLDGQVPVLKRMAMVDRFNNPKDKMKIMLLSLTAGGVGLNLIGANHLFLLDLHWNPQLENQAQDRIYRLGQKKPVFVYKLMATDTIEKRILQLQEKKLDMAEGMLTGSSQVGRNKLTLQDLKLLFEM